MPDPLTPPLSSLTQPNVGPVVPNQAANVLSKVPTAAPSYSALEGEVRGMTTLPGLTETILPAIRDILMPGKDNPYTAMIDRSTQANVAQGQTDSMRRGMTGSDIEAATMQGARNEGEMAKSNFFAQNSQQLASYMSTLATGDINTQRDNLMMFAQLMGQKITSDQDLQMFQQQLAANMTQASRNQDSALWGAGISAAGNILGGAAKAGMFSDERLKIGVKKIGRAAGFDIFKWRWSKVAQVFGAHDRPEVGLLAQDVEREYPEAVGEHLGWKTIDYSRLPERVMRAVQRVRAQA